MARATNGNRDNQTPYDPIRALVVDICQSAAKDGDIEFFTTDWGTRLLDFLRINPEKAIAAMKQNGNGHAD